MKNNSSNILIVIPAIKKNAIIPDQLVKKLNGITLIERAINIAKKITDDILVITDSEEISLICERNNVGFYRDSKLKIDSSNIINIVKSIVKSDKNILIYRANVPLVDEKILEDAYKVFLENEQNIVISVKKLQKKLLAKTDKKLELINNEDYFEELKAFLIFNSKSKSYLPYIIENEKSIEIESYQDWWVCEKLLQRKRIVFNVIGNTKVGMGHIYRALSLAHEITDHEIVFVCKEEDELAVEKIASKDYKVIPSKNVKETILKLKPDLVVNDILNTSEEFILTLKKEGIKIVNFEDLGSGAKYADIVFNELYDEPILPYNNIFWGYEWYFLRDEFYGAKPIKYREKVKNILITFGGTDQHNLTLLTLKSLLNLNANVNINIVCGSGYLYKEKLFNFLKSINKKNIDLTFATGVISKKMEFSDIAVTSNGRTVYELAHMHIPSIVISQHEREATHKFSKLENGFVNLGMYKTNIEDKLKFYLQKLISDNEYRYLLYLNTLKFNFLENKQKVIKKITELL